MDRFWGGGSPSIIFICCSEGAHLEALNSPAVLLQVGRDSRAELRGPTQAWARMPNNDAKEGDDLGQREHMGSRWANP